MALTQDIKEIRNKLEILQVDLNTVKIQMQNHLKHHTSRQEWFRWGIPILVATLIIVKELI